MLWLFFAVLLSTSSAHQQGTPTASSEPQTPASLFTLGDAALQGDDLALAYRRFSTALTLARRSGDYDAQGTALVRLSIVVNRRGQRQKRNAFLWKAALAYRKRGDAKGEAASLLPFANSVRHAPRRQRRAIRAYERALILYSAQDDRLGQGDVFLGLAQVYYLGGGDAAQSLYEAARESYLSAGDYGRAAEATVGLASVFARAGERPAARQQLDEADRLYGKAGNEEGLSRVELERAYIDLLDGQHAAAERVFRRALARMVTRDDRHAAANIMLHIASTLAAQGRRSDERTAVKRARRYDPNNSNAWIALATIDRTQHRFAHAEKLYRKAEQACRERLLTLCVGNALLGQGDLQMDLRRPAEAARLYARSLEVYRSINHPQGATNAANALARVHGTT